MTSNTSTRHAVGDQAVVLGASMAGLLAARILSEHFDRVTLVDRDRLVDDAQPRKGVPQGHHVHVLLGQGQLILEELFPRLMRDIIASGGS